MLKSKSDAIKIIKACRKDPVFFPEKVLGDKLWQKQKEILRAIQNNNVAVASCHGAGKSFTASRAVLHVMSTYPDTQVITTAPTNRQVKRVLWKEIRSGHKKAKIPLGGKVLTKEIQIDDEWFALGFATDDADQFQGFHGKRVLVVVDEAAGVSEEIYEGIDGVLSGANSTVLYIGNPTNTNGSFYDAYQSDQFKTYNISAFDTPNFTTYGIALQDIQDGSWKEKAPEDPNDLPYPMLITPQWVADKLDKWGLDSALFQAKVLGQFPEAEEYTIIPVYMWKNAQSKERIDAETEIESIEDCRAGLDVARFGTDSSCIVIEANGDLIRKETKSSMDTTEVAEWAHGIIKDTFLKKVSGYKKIKINVDVIGVGAGVADQLRNNLGYSNVIDVKVSEKAYNDEKFRNKRAEMYWDLRDNLKNGGAKVKIYDEELENQITSIRYEIDTKGRIKLESKKKIRKRLGVSPDEADAVSLAYYDTDQELNKDNSFVNAWMNGR